MDPRIELGLHIMETNLDKHFSLSYIARCVGLSASRFGHLLKQETGQTFRRHIQEMRLQRAKMLLEDPSLGIKEVASRTGYSSAASFSRSFKERYRLTPGNYRNKKLTNQAYYIRQQRRRSIHNDT